MDNVSIGVDGVRWEQTGEMNKAGCLMSPAKGGRKDWGEMCCLRKMGRLDDAVGGGTLQVTRGLGVLWAIAKEISTVDHRTRGIQKDATVGLGCFGKKNKERKYCEAHARVKRIATDCWDS